MVLTIYPILPFDIYNNKGVFFTKKIDSYQLVRPSSVQALNYVISGNYIYISWNPSEYANKYKIKIKANSKVLELSNKIKLL